MRSGHRRRRRRCGTNHSVLAELPVSIIEHPNWSNGLGSSIAVGVMHAATIAADLDAAIVLTCDQPFVDAAIAQAAHSAASGRRKDNRRLGLRGDSWDSCAV